MHPVGSRRHPGVLDWDETGIHRLTFDVRAPISSKAEELEKKITEGIKETGLVQTDISWSEGYYVSPDDELVKKLLDVYAARFGQRLEAPRHSAAEHTQGT